MLMRNLLIAQSGGPSAAINATVAGIVERCITSCKVDRVLGAINGIKGVLAGNFVDLTEKLDSAEKLDLLCRTPAAALGSCRLKLDPNDESQLSRIVETLQQHEIHYFIYIGGNDSMDTVDKLSAYVRRKQIPDLYIMGAPKTIDNDLMEIDHCPGFGSAAKYIATTFAELVRDCEVYDIPAVTIVEVMGRNAGWLTAASALSRENGGSGPQLIYLCERVFDVDRFVQDVRDQLALRSAVVVAVSEGVKTADGRYLCEAYSNGTTDVFGHAALSGTGKCLEQIVKERIGCKVRSIELNLMQRCASHLASQTDITESRLLGMVAADRALDGISGEMACITRLSDKPYRVKYGSVPVNKVANGEKKVPLEWITPSGCGVNQDMIDYLAPLIRGEMLQSFTNGVPAHISLY